MIGAPEPNHPVIDEWRLFKFIWQEEAIYQQSIGQHSSVLTKTSFWLDFPISERWISFCSLLISCAIIAMCERKKDMMSVL